MPALNGTFIVVNVVGSLRVDYPTASGKPDFTQKPTYTQTWSVTLDPVLDAGDAVNAALWQGARPQGGITYSGLAPDVAAQYPLGAIVSGSLDITDLSIAQPAIDAAKAGSAVKVGG
jgi:hypothetical protein